MLLSGVIQQCEARFGGLDLDASQKSAIADAGQGERRGHEAARGQISEGLQQSREDLGGNERTQGRESFKQTGDVGQVFLTLAGSPGWVQHRPNLVLQHVLNSGH